MTFYVEELLFFKKFDSINIILWNCVGCNRKCYKKEKGNVIHLLSKGVVNMGRWSEKKQDKRLNKILSGHYLWRMLVLILLFNTAAIGAQVTMAKKSAEEEIRRTVQNEREYVNKTLEEYRDLLYMSVNYYHTDFVTGKIFSNYIQSICQEKEFLKGMFLLQQGEGKVYFENGNSKEAEAVFSEETRKEFTNVNRLKLTYKLDQETKQGYYLMLYPYIKQDETVVAGFVLEEFPLLREISGEYLRTDTFVWELIYDNDTGMALFQGNHDFMKLGQSFFSLDIWETDKMMYESFTTMGLGKVRDEENTSYYLYVDEYDQWRLRHIYMWDMLDIGVQFVKTHSLLPIILLVVDVFLLTAGWFWHAQIYQKKKIERIKQEMSNSGIFRFMFSSKKVFFLNLNEKLEIEEVSERMIEEMCDIPIEEAIGTNLFSILYSDGLEEFIQEHQRSKEEVSSTILSFYERKNRKKEWYFVEMQNVSDITTGKEHYLMIFFEANALLVAEQVLYAIMQNTKDFMLILNEQYEVQFISDEAKRCLGITEQVVGKNVNALPMCQLDGRNLENVLSGVTRYQSFNATVHVDTQGTKKNWWATANAFVLLRETESYGILMVLKDITEYLEKTEEVARANTIKENLLFTVSHGIKTPLNALLGSADMLLTKIRTDTEDSAYLNNMKQAVKELAGMLDEVLAFTKLDSNKMELEETEFDFVKMLEGVASEAYMLLRSKQLVFYMELAPNLPKTIYADEECLKKALSNLLHIFSVVTESGYLKLCISCEEKHLNEYYLHFELQGTGTRNEREKESNFYRSAAESNASNVTYDSNNILCEFKYYICRDILELMGSTLEDGKKDQDIAYTAFDLPLRTNAQSMIVDVEEFSQNTIAILIKDAMLQKHCIEMAQALCLTITEPKEADYILTDGKEVYEEVQNRKGKQCLVLAEKNVRRNKKYEGILTKPFSIVSFARALRFEEKPDIASDLEESIKAMTGVRNVCALVVDDNSVNRMIATNMLKLLGAEVDSAEDGIQAVKKAKEKKYDVILMDHMMPNMDGVCATEEIRALEDETAPCLIFALTADLMEQVARMFEEAGANESLAKPLDLHMLKEQFLKWLPEERIVFEEELDEGTQEQQPEQEEVQHLPQIQEVIETCPEIEVEKGLSYLQGKEEQYIKVLQATVQSLEDCLRRLPVALQGSKEQRIVVHSMKGMYFGIGAESLAKKAAILESEIKNENMTFLEEHMQQFLEEAIQLKDKLFTIFRPKEEEAQEEIVLSKKDWEQYYTEAKEALYMFDLDTALERMAPLLAGSQAETKELIRQAKQKAENFEYDESLEYLEKAKEAWSIS